MIYVGWTTYLSSEVPVDEDILVSSGVTITEGDGGRYLTLDGSPSQPSLHQALLVRKALGY